MTTNWKFLGVAAVLFAIPTLGHAEWRLGGGLEYARALCDVSELYKSNADAPFDSNVRDFDTFRLPIGIKFAGNYEWENGARVDFDAGPYLFVLVDLTATNGNPTEANTLTYSDIPLAVTAGYTFIRGSSTSPYARIGVARHIVRGEFSESASPGALIAVGIEFMRMRTAQINVELAYDQSEVEFDKITCPNVGNCRTSRESLRTGDVMLGVAVKF